MSLAHTSHDLDLRGALMRRSLSIVVALFFFGCGVESTSAQEAEESSEDALGVNASFVARGTGYYPDSSALEGGFVDRRGKKLRTLQQFLAGDADYVSVAMDSKAFVYGQRLRIKELETKYGKPITFRVV